MAVPPAAARVRGELHRLGREPREDLRRKRPLPTLLEHVVLHLHPRFGPPRVLAGAHETFCTRSTRTLQNTKYFCNLEVYITRASLEEAGGELVFLAPPENRF